MADKHEHEHGPGREAMENYQVAQQQLQLLMLQKQQLKMQSEEIDHALKEIEKAKGDTYRIVGPVLLQAPKDEIVRDLQERKSLYESRIEILGKQEERIKKTVSDMRKSIEK
jgi:prefoldin beta subunit